MLNARSRKCDRDQIGFGRVSRKDVRQAGAANPAQALRAGQSDFARKQTDAPLRGYVPVLPVAECIDGLRFVELERDTGRKLVWSHQD